MATHKKHIKRRGLRVTPESDRPVSIDINGDNFLDVLRAIDIGEGGVGICVPHEFKDCHIDEKVSLIVSLPYPVNGHVTVMGKIRHVTGKTFGVIFVGMSAKDRKKLQEYIAYRIKDEPGFQALRFKFKSNVSNVVRFFYNEDPPGSI